MFCGRDDRITTRNAPSGPRVDRGVQGGNVCTLSTGRGFPAAHERGTEVERPEERREWDGFGSFVGEVRLSSGELLLDQQDLSSGAFQPLF